MALPVYTIKDLEDFANKPAGYFTTFADTAISQATLLFKIASCLNEAPSDPSDAELMKNAILDMAWNIYESNKYAATKFSPFSSETIGSYSYSRSMAKIKAGEDTGVMWFDLATMQLGVCELITGQGAYSSGGIEVFENDGTFVPGYLPGNSRLLSPNDIDEVGPFSLDGN